MFFKTWLNELQGYGLPPLLGPDFRPFDPFLNFIQHHTCQATF